MDDPAIVPSTPPLPPLPETPKLDGPFFVPAKPGAIPEEAPSVEPESPPKKGKPLLVGGLVLFILAGTIISYFALQKGPVWLRMGAQQAYPPTLTPVPPTPTQAVCTPQKTYSGSSGCSQGGSASITLTACVPTGCPATTVSYHEVKITCAGEDYASCEGVCGDSGTNKTLSVPAGGCESVSISCSSPQCGSCQVDFDEYGARRWQHSGCGTAPMSPPIPTVPPGGPSPTPTVPVPLLVPQ